MSGWITDDFACACGWRDTQLHKRDARPAEVTCPECGAAAPRQAVAQFMTVAYQDGVGRFDGIRKQRELQRAERKARKRRDKEGAAEARKELSKLRGRS